MMRLFRYLKPYWKQVALVSTLVLIQAIANLYLHQIPDDARAAVAGGGPARRERLSCRPGTAGAHHLLALLAPELG